jgi:hypothetical protein
MMDGVNPQSKESKTIKETDKATCNKEKSKEIRISKITDHLDPPTRKCETASYPPPAISRDILQAHPLPSVPHHKDLHVGFYEVSPSILDFQE